MASGTLLVVGGGIEVVPGIQLAKRMGLYTVVTDRNPEAPGIVAADDHIVVSTYDVEATVREALRYHESVKPIHGVISIGTDVPLTVANVAHQLGLPGIPVEVARLSVDKLAMKDKFRADGVPVPWYAAVDSLGDLRGVIAERGFPLVLKPVDSRGARGVLRLTADVDLKWAFELSRSYSATGRVMVEEFLEGPQVSTESLVLEGRAHTVGFSDRNYEYLERYAPHIIENGGELPSRLPQHIQTRVCELVQLACESIGMQQGVAKGDIVVVDSKPHVIELATRLSGGYFCTHETPLNTGVEFVRLAILLALGEHVSAQDLQPRRNQGVAQRYLFPSPGKVVRIDGATKVSSQVGIALCEVRVKVGDLVSAADCHPARAGVVIATGDTREEAVARAERAVGSIAVETVPSS